MRRRIVSSQYTSKGDDETRRDSDNDHDTKGGGTAGTSELTGDYLVGEQLVWTVSR